MSSRVTYGIVTLEVRCSRCGRLLGYYKGEEFWVDGCHPSETRIVCLKCHRELKRSLPKNE